MKHASGVDASLPTTHPELAIGLSPDESSNAAKLQKIREIISLVNAGSDVGAIFERIVFAVCHHTIWNYSGIMAVDRTIGYSVLVSTYGLQPAGREGLAQQWELATSPCLKVVSTKQPVVIEDAQISEEYPGYRADSRARGYHTVVLLPLGCTDMQGREMVLDVNSEKCVTVAADELDFLVTISHLAGLAVDKGKSLHSERALSSRLERVLEINSSLLDRVLHGNSMEIIAGMVETILPDPIVIVDLTTDSFHVTLSPDVMTFGDREWAEFVRGPVARQLIQLMLQTKPSDFRETRRLSLATPNKSFECDAYVEPLLIDGETVGGVIVFPRQRGLDKLDFLVAMEVKFALSVQLMRAHIQQQSHDYQLAELFTRLFEGGWQKDEQIHNRATRLGLDLSVPAQLLTVDIRGGSQNSARHKPYPAPRTFKRSLSQSFPNALLVYHAGVLVVYLPNPPENESSRVITAGRQLIDAVKWYFEIDPVFTLSPLCTRIEDYQSAREHCGRLLSLGRIFGRRGFVSQQDFGPFAVLLSGLDQHVATTFISQTLGQIEVYDKDNKTQLMQTAEAFIDRGCRYQATAEALGVHVSTLRYRMDRLKELFGLDLESEDSRFSVSLALRLRALLTKISEK